MPSRCPDLQLCKWYCVNVVIIIVDREDNLKKLPSLHSAKLHSYTLVIVCAVDGWSLTNYHHLLYPQNYPHSLDA